MKSVVKKEIAILLEEYDKNEKKFDGTLLKDLLLERKNLAVKEEKIVKDIIEYQDLMMEKIKLMQRNFTKTKGAIEIIEEMILKHVKEKLPDHKHPTSESDSSKIASAAIIPST